MINFRGDIREQSRRKFIVSSFISIDLDPITLCDDFNKRVIEGDFNEIII